ncbi:MAG: hypothetical protein BIFFINMI_03290 [Phycisphaerae bacterium]|nr:hypothetical protein [Phycisphaerae bacterium]
MNARRVMQSVLVAALAAAMAVPALGAETSNVIDLKAVDAQITAAQGQVVAGNVDAALKAIQDARAKAVTAELAARVAFVSKLAEVRLAEKLADPAKVVTALTEANGQAKQPDQVVAVWQTAVSVTRAMMAAKADAVPVIDFMAKVAPGIKQFSACMEVANLRLATGNLGAAEAELRNAAARAGSVGDWAAWVAAVSRLATQVEAQLPRAGADVFDRLAEVGKPAAAAMGIAKGRFLLARGVTDGVGALAEQAIAAATSDGEVLAGISLTYDLAGALRKAGKAEQASQTLAKAEALAQSRSASVALANIRGAALAAFGQPEKASEVFAATAQAVKTPAERDQMLSACGSAMVAAGNSADVPGKLQAAKAGPAVYVAVAGAMARAGDSTGALKLLAAVPPTAFAAEPQSVAGVAPLMQQIQAQRQQVAREQAARVKAIAAAFDAAAKAAQAKDPKAAAALTKQAAAMTALAGQVEK